MYDKNKDYAQAIQEAINKKASAYEVQQLNQERNAKIANEKTKGAFANDYFSQMANKYVNDYKPTSNGNSSYADLYNNSFGAAKRAAQYTNEQSIKNLAAQKPQIEQNYNKLSQQAYINNQIGTKKLNEQMALNGITGGLSESTLANANADYQNKAANISQEKNNALMQLENNINQVRANGDIQSANLMSQYYDKIAQAAISQDETNYNRYIQGLNMEMQKAGLTGQYQGQDTFQKQQYNNQIEQNTTQQAYEKAINEVKIYGKVITPESAKILGITLDNQPYTLAQQEANAPKIIKSSGGSSYKGPTIAQVTSAIQAYKNEGLPIPQELLNSYQLLMRVPYPQSNDNQSGTQTQQSNIGFGVQSLLNNNTTGTNQYNEQYGRLYNMVDTEMKSDNPNYAYISNLILTSGLSDNDMADFFKTNPKLLKYIENSQ